MANESTQIILFDGVCNLCNGWVNFVIDRDPDARFKFAPLQSDEARDLLGTDAAAGDDYESIVLLRDGEILQKSDAVLAIAGELTGAWPLLKGFKIVPRVIRDAVYDVIARNRYDWFGRSDSCRLPTPDLQARFLAQQALSSTDT